MLCVSVSGNLTLKAYLKYHCITSDMADMEGNGR